MLEITLTRIFSVLMWGHHSFLVISTALLGFGAAGSYLSVKPKQYNQAESRRFLGRNCLYFALSLVLSVMVCTRLGYVPRRTFVDLYHTLMLPTMYFLLAVPFFFAGLSIGFLLSSFAKQINAIYFSDLLGGGLGALAVTFLLSNVGAPAGLLIAGLLAIFSGLLFLGPQRRWTAFAWLGGYAGLVVLVGVFDPWHIPVPRGKGLYRDHRKVVDTRWSLLARIDILPDAQRPLNFGCGTSKEFLDRPVAYRPFYMDGSNPSRMIKYDQDHWFIDKLLSATPYALAFEKPKVLIIGSGGGIDTLVALHHDAGHVTAVEINPATVALVRKDYADYIGNLFDRPNVTLLAEEGRHFLTVDRGKYDIIRLTGVDTRAASAIGANAQDHAYLYTVEAVRDLFNHLTDDGVLAITRGGTQHIRLLAVILTSLEELGIADAPKRLVVVTNGRWTDVLVRRRPFRPDEVDAIIGWARPAKMKVMYDPLHERDNSDDRFVRLTPEDRERLYQESAENLRPVTDDSPFFFERKRLGDVLASMLSFDDAGAGKIRVRSGYPMLLLALAGAGVLSVLLILLPLFGVRGGSRGTQNRGWSLAYFCMLGLGFILAELIFIQKYMIFLGGPIYSLSVTLFSILVFSGLGAYTAKRIDVSSPLARVGLLASVVALLLLTSAFLRWGLPQLLGYQFPVRVMLGIASLAPVSFLMGMPFPVGIRILERTSGGLIAWAWAGNACLTVIGSVLSVIISIHWGFYTAMMVAAVCYVLAGVCLLNMKVGQTAMPKPAPDPEEVGPEKVSG